MLKSSNHVWHMVLVAGIVVVAISLGAAEGTAWLFAALTCAAMLTVLVWFVVRTTRDDAGQRGPFAPPEPDRR